MSDTITMLFKPLVTVRSIEVKFRSVTEVGVVKSSCVVYVGRGFWRS